MEKEIIYDKTSEEYKAIKLLESKTTNYSDDGLILHYNTILYNLIINLMKENEKQKEVINKITDIINDYLKEDYSIYTENEIEVDLIVKLKNILKEVSE